MPSTSKEVLTPIPLPPLAPPSTLATACVKLISSSVKARLKLEGVQSTPKGSSRPWMTAVMPLTSICAVAP